MLSQGYTLGAKKAYEDDYFKLPVYNYEMHLSLSSGTMILISANTSKILRNG